jgi:hypothetical protein
VEFYHGSPAGAGSSYAFIADERRYRFGDPGLSELGIDQWRPGDVL